MYNPNMAEKEVHSYSSAIMLNMSNNFKTGYELIGSKTA